MQRTIFEVANDSDQAWEKLKDSEKIEQLFDRITALEGQVKGLTNWNTRIVNGIFEHLNGRGAEIMSLIDKP